MKYTFETAEKSTVKIVITFNGEEWKNAIDKAYARTRGKYSVPGFRKGKVPKPVLENYYGKGVFFDEAFNVLYSENYPQIIEREKDNFTVVGAPDLSVDELSDENVVLSAIVPVKPEVKIGSYKGLEIKKYEYNVTEEDIKNEVNKILLREAKTVEVTDRACANGDVVNIDFEGSVNGEKFAGGSMEKYDLELGSGSFIPGFESQVVGMQIGEEKDIVVHFPADYQADNLKDKDATFRIKLHAIKGKELPELTDEYVKKHAGCETVAEYTEKVKTRLENKAASDSRDQTENSILQAICATCECEIPAAMTESEIDGIVNDFAQRLAYQGLQLKDYIEYMGQTMEQFRAQFADQAKNRVLTQLVIEKIIKDEKITATPEEIEAEIAKQAASVEKTVEEYKKNLDPRRIDYIANDIVITKLFDFLSANNNLVA